MLNLSTRSLARKTTRFMSEAQGSQNPDLCVIGQNYDPGHMKTKICKRITGNTAKVHLCSRSFKKARQSAKRRKRTTYANTDHMIRNMGITIVHIHECCGGYLRSTIGEGNEESNKKGNPMCSAPLGDLRRRGRQQAGGDACQENRSTGSDGPELAVTS